MTTDRILSICSLVVGIGSGIATTIVAISNHKTKKELKVMKKNISSLEQDTEEALTLINQNIFRLAKRSDELLEFDKTYADHLQSGSHKINKGYREYLSEISNKEPLIQ